MSGRFKYYGPDEWDAVARSLERSTGRGDVAGLDTEFYGLGPRGHFDVRKESTAGGRVGVHLWSVAIKRHPHKLTARGYHIADTAVLLADSLEHPGLRRWLESDAPKVCHNLSVDQHAFAGSGVVLGGAFNTLARARWVWPERARANGFSLDSLGLDLLGIGKTDSFVELFSEEVEEQVGVKIERTKMCSCGVEKCRKRKGHVKTEVVTEIPKMKMVTRRIPLETVFPGHRIWDRAVAYAARDAWLALAIQDRIDREMGKETPWPWA